VTVEFAGSPRHTLGIELELSLVDEHTRELAHGATAVLDDLGPLAGRPATDPAGTDGAEPPKVKHELFECTVEIITGVCDTVADARADLQSSLDAVRTAAAARGYALASSGTHPFSRWRDQRVTADPRYEELVGELQWTARRLAIFGVHFHVGVPTGDRAVSIANALRGYLPLLLALSASSPYWEGEDSGLASARCKVFESLPTAGLPPPLANWAEFVELMDTLVRAESIRSIREIWWDVRPHPDFGTVELRMCDAPPTLTEVAAIAALAHSLVTHLDEQLAHGEPLDPRNEWTVRENKWLAARHGVDAQLITDLTGNRRAVPDLVDDLVTELAPTARELGCLDELAGLTDIVQTGPSYARQRAVRAAGGSALDVVDHLVRELATGEPDPP
jgi:carboxylate-amine ligase